jgi:hypothetical protein
VVSRFPFFSEKREPRIEFKGGGPGIKVPSNNLTMRNKPNEIKSGKAPKKRANLKLPRKPKRPPPHNV